VIFFAPLTRCQPRSVIDRCRPGVDRRDTLHTAVVPLAAPAGMRDEPNGRWRRVPGFGVVMGGRPETVFRGPIAPARCSRSAGPRVPTDCRCQGPGTVDGDRACDLLLLSSPDRIRTGVTALRGRRPRPLDDGAKRPRDRLAPLPQSAARLPIALGFHRGFRIPGGLHHTASRRLRPTRVISIARQRRKLPGNLRLPAPGEPPPSPGHRSRRPPSRPAGPSCLPGPPGYPGPSPRPPGARPRWPRRSHGALAEP
jgi:hypothetical protein